MRYLVTLLFVVDTGVAKEVWTIILMVMLYMKKKPVSSCCRLHVAKPGTLVDKAKDIVLVLMILVGLCPKG